MAETFNGVAVPADGARITYKDGRYQIPDNPVVPFIEGDGTGRDIWKASVRVFNAGSSTDLGRACIFSHMAGQLVTEPTWLDALGVAPDGRAGTVDAGSGIDPVDAGALDTDTALRELVERLADVTERIRARMDRLGEIDLASQDVLVEVVRELEKQLWMLRVSLPA